MPRGNSGTSRRRGTARMVSWTFVTADSEASVLRVAASLGLDDPSAVRRLLGAWWVWAGALTARGELADSDAFLAQREAEGLLEPPMDVATGAIELELPTCTASGRRAGPRARAERRRRATPVTSASFTRALDAIPPRRPRQGARPRSRRRASPALVGTIASGTLFVLVVGGIASRARPPRALPGGSSSPTTGPTAPGSGSLRGRGGGRGAPTMRLRPASADALRLPALGLVPACSRSDCCRRGLARVGGRRAVRGRRRGRGGAPGLDQRVNGITRRPSGAGDSPELALLGVLVRPPARCPARDQLAQQRLTRAAPSRRPAALPAHGTRLADIGLTVPYASRFSLRRSSATSARSAPVPRGGAVGSIRRARSRSGRCSVIASA